MKAIRIVILNEIRRKPGHFLILILGITAAVFLATVITVFSTSCLQAMIRQEKEEHGPYEAVFHHLTHRQAEALAEHPYVKRVWKIDSCEDAVIEGRACYGISFSSLSHSIFKKSQVIGAEIKMDRLPEEEIHVIFSRRTYSISTSYDITFNEKLLGYYGINTDAVAPGSAVSIILMDFVIILFTAVLLYYIVLSGLEDKLKTAGLLDGIGISPMQKNFYLTGELWLAGFLAIPLGCILGLLVLMITIRKLNSLFLPTVEITPYVRPLSLAAVCMGCILLLFLSSSGLVSRARDSGILTLISGYNQAEERNRTAVLLTKNRLHLKAETLLAFKNILIHHKNYYISSVLLVIALCVFLNGLMYIKGLTSIRYDHSLYPPYSLWAEETGQMENLEKFQVLAEKLKKCPYIDRVSLLTESENYIPLENLSKQEIEEYLSNIHAEDILELYRTYGISYTEEAVRQNADLRQIVRIIGMDNDTAKNYLASENISFSLYDQWAILDKDQGDQNPTFPVMIRGEEKEIPIAMTIDPSRHKELLLPEFLSIAKNTLSPEQPFVFSNHILYVNLNTYRQLMATYPKHSVYLELTVKQDQDTLKSINDIIYPSFRSQDLKTDKAVMKTVRKAAKECGLEQIQIYSFAQEYRTGFFTGGKGMNLLLVTAAVTAVWAMTILLILQKDAACMRKRKKEFALLQSVGMPPYKIRKMLFLEHMIYPFFGIFAGIPLSIFFLSGLYKDGGAPQMTSPFDIPWNLVAGQLLIIITVLIVPFLFSSRELHKTDMLSEIRREE